MCIKSLILKLFGIDYVSLEERVAALEQYIAEKEMQA